jgi:uncharacterized membrane protein
MASLEVWAHLATAISSILLGAVMLIRQKGDGLHKALGRTWVVGSSLSHSPAFSYRLLTHRSGAQFTRFPFGPLSHYFLPCARSDEETCAGVRFG